MIDPGTDAEGLTLVTQYYPPERGAAQVRLGSVVGELVRRGWRVQVVTALPNYPLGRIFDGWDRRPVQRRDEGGVTVRRVWLWAAMGSGPARILNYVSFGAMSVLGLVGTPRRDQLVIEYPTLFGALPAVVVAGLRRQRTVLLVADLWVDSIAEMGTVGDGAMLSLLRRVERWMLRRVDVVTAVTEGVRDELLRKGVEPERMAWMPNGVDTEMFSPGEGSPELRDELGLAEGEHLVLYAGTHGYVHGLEVVLDAAGLLDDLPVRFVLVGDGSEKAALVDGARRRRLGNVHFLDPVAPEQVARLLRVATVALATVRRGDVYKTIRSAKALPAMATARPVVYSGDDEGSALVRSIGSGITTEPGDAAALAAALRELIEHPEAAAAMGARGREWVVQHASWRRVVGEWLDQLGASGTPGAAGALTGHQR